MIKKIYMSLMGIDLGLTSHHSGVDTTGLFCAFLSVSLVSVYSCSVSNYSKGSFICIIPQTGQHNPWPLLHQLWSTGLN